MTRLILALAFLLACLTITSALPQRAVLDFDGDNKTDYAVVRIVSGHRHLVHPTQHGRLSGAGMGIVRRSMCTRRL